MKIFFIGLGQAGGKITDLFIADDLSTKEERIFDLIREMQELLLEGNGNGRV